MIELAGLSGGTLVLFAGVSAALVATPGPNVALIVATSLKHGRRAGLATVAGVNFGLLIQLAVIVAGLSSLVELFARGFDVIRYAGAAYLLWLALRQWRRAGQSDGLDGPAAPPSDRAALLRGLLVAFANPKTLLFHAAFLPQFVTPGVDAERQIVVLALVFAFVAVVGDGVWALLAGSARRHLGRHFARTADRISAGILAGGAVLLLAAGRR
ncbi:MAG TPA: LysE family translocator [Xanthobacteraceae bacterium]|nr:LysE family translocator [Xanthobacteraceae bacterium]